MIRNINDYILGLVDILDLNAININFKINLTEQNNVKNIMKKRSRDSHKGTYGRVGFLSGSKGMAGAAVLNCNAALRSGSGLVKACITDSIYNVVESMTLETITYPFDEMNISFDELERELIKFSDVIATGSGCTNMKGYRKLLECLIESSEKPLVIDAEGINVLNLKMLKSHKQNIILTPHYGEMSKLIKKDISYLRDNIIDEALEFSTSYNVYLVLKGARTIIASPNGDLYINTTGNPGMATAGSGDVLTGILASFIGQKIDIINALRAAVYVHGLAGDIGSRFVGEYALTAGDLITYLPNAIKRIVEE